MTDIILQGRCLRLILLHQMPDSSGKAKRVCLYMSKIEFREEGLGGGTNRQSELTARVQSLASS